MKFLRQDRVDARQTDLASRFPTVSNKWVYGLEQFLKQTAVSGDKGFGVQFFLRGYKERTCSLPLRQL
jgi:hypothetical protein